MASSEIIFTRRHPELEKREKIHRLIADAYTGGSKFLQQDYLFRHPKETEYEYRFRKIRATYFNYVQPLVDILTGLMYTEPPKREIPDAVSYLLSSASHGKSLQQFMMRACSQSLLYTCGILVDSPRFDVEEVRTRRDRIERNLNPYLCFYQPMQIRDFYCEDGALQWIILDNSEREADNPFMPAKTKRCYRLWTREYYQDFEMQEDSTTPGESAPVEHGLGEVPFIFLSWKDTDPSTMLAETPFEDIAIHSRSIYNYMSLMDEMLSSGTFRTLFYPVVGSQDVPKSLEEKGIGSLMAIPFDGSASQKPFYDGAGLEDVASFLSVIDLYSKQILSKVGLDKDNEKNFAQSGVAKSLEYRKAHALLSIGAESMQRAEIEIVRLTALWESTQIDPDAIKISYPDNFDPDAVARRAAEMQALFTAMPYPKVRALAAGEIVNASFPNLPQAEKAAIMTEIQDYKEPDANMALNTILNQP